jgi:hypothetical protein
MMTEKRETAVSHDEMSEIMAAAMCLETLAPPGYRSLARSMCGVVIAGMEKMLGNTGDEHDDFTLRLEAQKKCDAFFEQARPRRIGEKR